MRARRAAGLAALAALAAAAKVVHCQRGLISSLGRYSVCCPANCTACDATRCDATTPPHCCPKALAAKPTPFCAGAASVARRAACKPTAALLINYCSRGFDAVRECFMPGFFNLTFRAQVPLRLAPA